MYLRAYSALAVLLCSVISCSAQISASSPLADGRTILAQSVATMAGAIPADCTAVASAELEAGGRMESGTIRVLTRGTGESRQEIQTEYTHSLTVYSLGLAREDTDPLSSVEKSLTSQTVVFPLPLLASIVVDTDITVTLIGEETAASSRLIHLRSKKAYADSPKMRDLVPLTQKDIWIDAATLLPRRISFEQRDGTAGFPGVQHDYFFSDYRSVQGSLFPFLVLQSLNGTPWGTFRFQSVTFNTGLLSSSFNVQ